MRPKSEIYTPKRDDEHPHPFHMRSPPPGIKEREDVARVGRGGDYSREAIIVNILVKGELLFEGGDQSEGRLLFEKIRI